MREGGGERSRYTQTHMTSHAHKYSSMIKGMETIVEDMGREDSSSSRNGEATTTPSPSATTRTTTRNLLTMDSPTRWLHAARATLSPMATDPLSGLDGGGSAATTPNVRHKVSKAVSEKANVVLDTSNPMHITLPTFRMVVLANKQLKQFFKLAFSASFRTINGLSSLTPTTPSLTSFSSLGFPLSRRNSSGNQPAVRRRRELVGQTRRLCSSTAFPTRSWGRLLVP